jgi:putative transposase
MIINASQWRGKALAKPRTRSSAQFKFQLALEAAKGLKTINALAREHGVQPPQLSEWQRQLLEAGDPLFTRNGTRQHREQREQEVELYEHMGRLKMALEGLKKKLPDSAEAKRLMIDLAIPPLSIRRPCALLG